MDGLELQIACSAVDVPAEGTLEERITAAMKYTKSHESDIFWMSHRKPDADMMIRVALGAVMVKSSEEDKDRITRSLKPLRMLSAMLSGIPVDFSQMEIDDDMVPIMKLWGEAA